LRADVIVLFSEHLASCLMIYWESESEVQRVKLRPEGQEPPALSVSTFKTYPKCLMIVMGMQLLAYL